jgi:hypothetical protein
VATQATIRFGDRIDWPAVAPNAAALPYAIQVRGWMLWLSAAFYLLAGAGCIGIAAWYWHSTPWDAISKAFVCAALCGVGLLMFAPIYYLFRPSLILYPDRIEKIGLTGSTTLERRAIKGIEVAGDSDDSQFVQLKPIDGHGKPIRMHNKGLLDPVLAEWLNGIRDLTAETYQASEAEILADPRFGGTEKDRARRLAVARRIVQGAQIVGLGVYLWAIVYPHPYLWAVGATALLPWVATLLVWTSGDLIIWSSDKATARPSVIGIIYGSVGALVLRAFLDIDLLDWALLLAASAIAGLIAAVLLSPKQGDGGQRVWILLIIAILPAAYVYGVASQLNVVFDNSRAEAFPLVVLSKSESTGRNASYDLDVGPWADRPAGTLSITRKLYDEVPVRSTICVYRHTGWLRLRWFYVDHCDGWKPVKSSHPALKG